MLSYQHAYHAGNHADILKHFVLTFVLESLNAKEKPYTFFDTHSGSALYDLLENRSLKTNEAQRGILSLEEKLSASKKEEYSTYFNLVDEYLQKKIYPGSPLIELKLMRKDDHLVLSELHPGEYENLEKNIAGQKTSDSCNVQIHKRNGFEMLKALTPPKTKRGAVLIDPSYEEVKDYKDVFETIKAVNKKWSNGIILLWYPLLRHRENEINSMIENITRAVKENNQNIEIENFTLCVNSKDSHKEVSLEELKSEENNPPRLYGSGMLVINTPWKLKEAAESFIESVKDLVS